VCVCVYIYTYIHICIYTGYLVERSDVYRRLRTRLLLHLQSKIRPRCPRHRPVGGRPGIRPIPKHGNATLSGNFSPFLFLFFYFIPKQGNATLFGTYFIYIINKNFSALLSVPWRPVWRSCRPQERSTCPQPTAPYYRTKAPSCRPFSTRLIAPPSSPGMYPPPHMTPVSSSPYQQG
jgi:hypothetical protein